MSTGSTLTSPRAAKSPAPTPTTLNQFLIVSIRLLFFWILNIKKLWMSHIQISNRIIYKFERLAYVSDCSVHQMVDIECRTSATQISHKKTGDNVDLTSNLVSNASQAVSKAKHLTRLRDPHCVRLQLVSYLFHLSNYLLIMQ